MTSTPKVVRLSCPSQNYAWGKVGNDSLVAQLARGHGHKVDPAQPYAELWMGTHPNGPAMLCNKDHSTSLRAYLGTDDQAKTLLNSQVYVTFQGELPFLFKVLSIAKALSIQAHPDKALATTLHRQFPTIYKDPNHKPEMALALTPFEALCGFRDPAAIVAFCRTLPPLAQLLGTDVVQALEEAVSAQGGTNPAEGNLKAALRALFERLMKSSPEAVETCIRELLMLKDTAPDGTRVVLDLMARLHQQFPGDVGCLCVFVLNNVHLIPGEAIFLGANEPHAYLSGDCIECMATSDNVVRAGLTPKFKDVDVLLNMLTYEHGAVEKRIMRGEPTSDDPTAGFLVTKYDPPISEFTVLHIQAKTAGTENTMAPVAGPSLLLVTQGSGRLSINHMKSVESFELRPGFVYFIAADTSTTVERDRDSPDDLECYRAYCVVE
ncbi:Mannose-6-phosphate isomerase [Dispira parvispora]|uniref:Mannose-6-phosphate isomerase n=1 Tax=Dispira parvispora TaxID=1520584 RepID=A0A9W8AXK2_9FUNG|nr:Mannose-6-phosphate isomerase [Dispira parvispora]